jgi:hypothetical protein
MRVAKMLVALEQRIFPERCRFTEPGWASAR